MDLLEQFIIFRLQNTEKASIIQNNKYKKGEIMNSVDIGRAKSIKFLPKIETKNSLLQNLLSF